MTVGRSGYDSFGEGVLSVQVCGFTASYQKHPVVFARCRSGRFQDCSWLRGAIPSHILFMSFGHPDQRRTFPSLFKEGLGEVILRCHRYSVFIARFLISDFFENTFAQSDCFRLGSGIPKNNHCPISKVIQQYIYGWQNNE